MTDPTDHTLSDSRFAHLEHAARRLIATGRSTQYVADLTGLPRHHVQLLAAAVSLPEPRRMRGPDRQPRGPQQPDAHGRVAWYVGRVPVEFVDRLRLEAAQRGIGVRDLVVQLCEQAMSKDRQERAS